MPDVTKATVELPVHAPLLTWMAVHGVLCLGLRHPEMNGPSRRIVEDFVRQLGQALVANGLLTAQELREAEHLERQQSHGRRRGN